MKLFIVRHAVALEKDEFGLTGRPDEERPLTLDGAKEMRKVAAEFADSIKAADLIATSPLVRARQTAEILQDHWPAKEGIVVIDALKPGAPFSEALSWLKEACKDRDTERARIAFVGHEPHLGGLTSWLLTGQPPNFFEYRKGGAALIEFDRLVEGRGRLRWLLTPALIKKLT